MDGIVNLQRQRVELDRVVELTQQHVGVDVVFVAEQTRDGYVYRAVAGDARSFGIELDRLVPERGLTSRLVSGEVPKVVCDTATEARVADVPTVRDRHIGSFVGVPLCLSDGTPYGALCCLSHGPDHDLGERDVRFLTMLGELIIPDLDDARAEQRLRKELLSLVETESVDVAYQPIFDLHTQRCLGVEALARFPPPFAAPDQTFAAAERLGIGLELEELVVRQAWTLLSRLGPSQYLALNLTPASLLALARRANRRQEIPLSSLVIEITEHTEINAYADLRGELERLRERGLRLAVDDAGAGYASLRHVLELRPDIIKVDRSLIHGVASDCAREIAVRAFVSMARDLGATVVAEGVELRADCDRVRELGVDAAQGFLLGRPSTDPRFLTEWLGSAKSLFAA